ncbi:MAG: hypothetical protein ACFFFT_03830 [Candidatus Thorarchaeota archaeon]
MESPLEKVLEDKLYSYLKENQEKAFTMGALLERLEEIVLDPEVRKYGKENIKKLLKKMRDNGNIKSSRIKLPHQNKNYYWFLDPEYPLRMPANFVSLKKRKTGYLDYYSNIIAGITAIIGLIFIIAGGIMFSIPESSTGNDQLSPSVPASLTFIIVGVLVLFISLMIATHRSKCWECCPISC